MDLKVSDGVLRSIILSIIFGLPGACILLGLFDILIGDSFATLGYLGVRSHGWLFLGTGIGLYLIELFGLIGSREKRV